MKKYFWLPLLALFFAFHMLTGSASAADTPKDVRTIPSNEGGNTVVVEMQDLLAGERLFKSVCADCHNQGGTKPNPNISLSASDLAGAFPARDNLAGFVDYLNNPTEYDGTGDISIFHPSTKSSDIYPEMRDLTDENLEQISAYVLIQGKIQPDKWGKGKYAF